MEKLKSVLGGSFKDRIRNAAKGFKLRKKKEVKPTIPWEEVHVCLFPSKAHLEVWVFCSELQISYVDWILAHGEIFGEDPDKTLFDEPKTTELDKKGKINLAIFDRAQQLQPWGDYICRVCYNTGFVHIVRCPLMMNHTPGKLTQTICWCKR